MCTIYSSPLSPPVLEGTGRGREVNRQGEGEVIQ